MKRLRSYDDLSSVAEKCATKGSATSRSSLHRDHYKSETARVGLSSSHSARYDRLAEEEREGSRSVRKRSDHHADNERRKGSDRHRDYVERGGNSLSSPRSGYGMERLHRSSSFCGTRREYPKGFRSERGHSRQERTVSAKGSKGEVEEKGDLRSPKALRDAKSPACSKDSSSEQSKSIEDRKSKETNVQHNSSSEMEEGELDPELPAEQFPKVEPGDHVNAVIGSSSDVVEADTPNEVVNLAVNDHSTTLLENDKCTDKEEKEEEAGQSVAQTYEEGREEKTEFAQHIQEEVNEPHVPAPGCIDVHAANNDETINHSKKEIARAEKDLEKAVIPLIITAKCVNQGKMPEINKENAYPPEVGSSPAADTALFSMELKSKEEVTMNPRRNIEADLSSNSKLLTVDMATEVANGTTCANNEIDEPATRCFELFTSTSLKKLDTMDLSVSKHDDVKLMLEPLDLSLSLPNVLLPVSSSSRALGSPTKTRSICSLANTVTNSEEITTSAFSDSQFIHNPSCSLTHNSLDNYERSVGSRPIFQGSDQVSCPVLRGGSFNESKQNEGPNQRRALLNGSALIQHPESSLDLVNSHVQVKHHGVLERSSKQLGLARQLSFQKQLAEMKLNGMNSGQTLHSHEIGFEYADAKKQIGKQNHSCDPHSISSHLENEQAWVGGTDLVKMLISMTMSEPVHAVSSRFRGMPDRTIAALRDCTFELLTNEMKHEQLCTIQKSLQKRSDVTLDALLKCPRSLLEVMVSLKTGLQDFLHPNSSIPSSELAEIFLNLRCRNLNCRSSVPVDECDCKVCSQENGFCSSCMCLLCGKFDTASNTCSWVGCDLCLHWCHTDCGLVKNYIKSGPTVGGGREMSEVQFYCVACGHPSEMYGFVKEVFQNFAKIWSVKTLSKELEYVRRIFYSSKDARGRKLHDLADELLTRLKNGSEPFSIHNPIFSFLTEANEPNRVTESTHSCKEQVNGGSAEITRQGKAVAAQNSSFADESRNANPEERVVDELERIVRIKEAEANMFQARADGARREAEGLKRIADAKGDKIEEEFAARIAKLRLAEAEEMRKQKLEHLHALERAHLDYLNMKMRMEADIKDLLSKMESTKHNLVL